MNEMMDFTTKISENSAVVVGTDIYSADDLFLQFENSTKIGSSVWRMYMNREQAGKICTKLMELLGIIPVKSSREKIAQAIKTAECVDVDYSGMDAVEIKELDDALDLIFSCARFMAKEGETK